MSFTHPEGAPPRRAVYRTRNYIPTTSVPPPGTRTQVDSELPARLESRVKKSDAYGPPLKELDDVNDSEEDQLPEVPAEIEHRHASDVNRPSQAGLEVDLPQATTEAESCTSAGSLLFQGIPTQTLEPGVTRLATSVDPAIVQRTRLHQPTISSQRRSGNDSAAECTSSARQARVKATNIAASDLPTKSYTSRASTFGITESSESSLTTSGQLLRSPVETSRAPVNASGDSSPAPTFPHRSPRNTPQEFSGSGSSGSSSQPPLPPLKLATPTPATAALIRAEEQHSEVNQSPGSPQDAPQHSLSVNSSNTSPLAPPLPVRPSGLKKTLAILPLPKEWISIGDESSIIQSASPFVKFTLESWVSFCQKVEKMVPAQFDSWKNYVEAGETQEEQDVRGKAMREWILECRQKLDEDEGQGGSRISTKGIEDDGFSNVDETVSEPATSPKVEEQQETSNQQEAVDGPSQIAHKDMPPSTAPDAVGSSSSEVIDREDAVRDLVSSPSSWRFFVVFMVIFGVVGVFATFNHFSQIRTTHLINNASSPPPTPTTPTAVPEEIMTAAAAAKTAMAIDLVLGQGPIRTDQLISHLTKLSAVYPELAPLALLEQKNRNLDVLKRTIQHIESMQRSGVLNRISNEELRNLLFVTLGPLSEDGYEAVNALVISRLQAVSYWELNQEVGEI